MSVLRFQRLHLVSHRERRAKTIEFHPSVTVVKGVNDVGKSSIAKSLYGSLGADAAVEHPRWLSASVISLLEFTVDDRPYVALREGKTFTLFEGDRFLGSFTSVTNGLAPVIARILAAKLRLADRSGKVVVPPPAYLFLPFYADQDKSWSETWASFARLQQFSDWKKEVVYFHVGINDSKHFEALEDLALASADKAVPSKELDGMVALRRRAAETLSEDIDVEMDSEVFATEIAQLVERVASLADLREKERIKLAKLSEQRMQLIAQKEILEKVRKELHADYAFAVGLEDDEVECPTCGQIHQNSFGERFAIAQDEAKTGDLLLEVLDGIAEVSAKVAAARARLEESTQEEQGLQHLLTRKRGQVTFARMLERAGHKTFSLQLEEQIVRVAEQVSTIDLRIAEAKERLEAAKSPERRRAILERYVSLMRAYLRLLDVSLPEGAYSKLAFPLKETGSDKPRAILAYTYAVLRLIWEAEGGIRCPIVMDSPKQQDQDHGNHLRILEFIRDERPEDSQLVLFLVDDENVNFGGSRVELEEKYFLLAEEDYSDAALIVDHWQRRREAGELGEVAGSW